MRRSRLITCACSYTLHSYYIALTFLTQTCSDTRPTTNPSYRSQTRVPLSDPYNHSPSYLVVSMRALFGRVRRVVGQLFYRFGM